MKMQNESFMIFMKDFLKKFRNFVIFERKKMKFDIFKFSTQVLPKVANYKQKIIKYGK